MRIPKDGDIYIYSNYKCYWKIINNILHYSVAIYHQDPEFWHIAKAINILDMEKYWKLENSSRIRKKLGIK